jgi:CRP-like cAMP-binding protein
MSTTIPARHDGLRGSLAFWFSQLIARWSRTLRTFGSRALGSPQPPSPGFSGTPRGPGARSQRQLGVTRQRDPAGPIFWEELDPIARDAFRSVAVSRTFAARARLMKEDDQADHVIVILSGRAKICVEENGRERIIAERGPGQLVGEHAALRISVRPASVIALETVQALVVRTGEFASFISAHPTVLEIVESQLYDRLTEGQGRQARLRQFLNGENCTVMLSDVVGFGARSRTDEDRRIIRGALFRITHAAMRGIPDVWSWEDRGDGLLMVIPPNVPSAEVVQHLHSGLPTALEEHNRAYRDSARIQLRVAVNVGPVTSDAMGISGEAIIITARLVEAPLFKKAMDETGANLGVIASTFIYDTVIRHDPQMAGYSQVRVDVKESSILGWIKLFGA